MGKATKKSVSPSTDTQPSTSKTESKKVRRSRREPKGRVAGKMDPKPSSRNSGKIYMSLSLDSVVLPGPKDYQEGQENITRDPEAKGFREKYDLDKKDQKSPWKGALWSLPPPDGRVDQR
ncbi:hypothetical protein HispidOSU_022402 [Sigmodon hispidus]